MRVHTMVRKNKVITLVGLVVILLLNLLGCRSPNVLNESTILTRVEIPSSGSAIMIAELVQSVDLETILPMLTENRASLLRVSCSPSDTLGLMQLLSTEDIPITLSTCTTIVITFEQQDLTWRPDYSLYLEMDESEINSDDSSNSEVEGTVYSYTWTDGRNSIYSPKDCTFRAEIVIENNTGRRLLFDSLEIVDDQRNILQTPIMDSLICMGITSYQWWKSNGMSRMPIVVLNGTGDGLWKAVQPCILEHSGELLARDSGLPIMQGDTLWYPYDELDISVESYQCRGGYEYLLNVMNTTDRILHFKIHYPDYMPDGMRVVNSMNLDGIPPSMGLYPGVEANIPYRIVDESVKY